VIAGVGRHPEITVKLPNKGDIDMITGMEKVCKDKTFNAPGCLCILFARNPEIFSGI